MRLDLPEYAWIQGGTAEQNKQMATGLVAYYGTYDVQGNTLTLHTEGASRSDWRNKDLKRTIDNVSKTQFRYTDRLSADTSVHITTEACPGTR